MPLNPLTPNSEQYQYSANDTHILSIEIVVRINDHQREKLML